VLRVRVEENKRVCEDVYKLVQVGGRMVDEQELRCTIKYAPAMPGCVLRTVLEKMSQLRSHTGVPPAHKTDSAPKELTRNEWFEWNTSQSLHYLHTSSTNKAQIKKACSCPLPLKLRRDVQFHQRHTLMPL